MARNDDHDYYEDPRDYPGGKKPQAQADVVGGFTMGAHAAKAVKHGGSIVNFGKSTKKQTPYISVVFEFGNGPNKGRRIKWDGYLSPNAAPYTFEALRTMGMIGDDILSIKELPNEVELVLAGESYTNDKGQTFVNPRIQFVNRLGAALSVPEDQLIPADELRQLAAQLKAVASAPPPTRERKAQPAEPSSGYSGGNRSPDDDIPF